MTGPGRKIVVAGLAALGLAGCETASPAPQIPPGVMGGVAVSGPAAQAAPAYPQAPAYPASTPGQLPTVAEQGIYGGLYGGEQGSWIDG